MVTSMLIYAEISFAITYHVVNGWLDLVNLFPVKLDLKPFIDAWGNAVTFRLSAPDETTNLTDAVLRECPFFGHFENRNIYTSTNGVIVSENPAYRAQLLADAIPAESFAVGANPVEAWKTGPIDTRNIDMSLHFKTRMDVSPVQDWIHSFFLRIPYMCVHGLYDNIVSRIPKEVSNE